MTGALRDVTRGSGPNDGCSSREVLGPTITTPSEESDEGVLGM